MWYGKFESARVFELRPSRQLLIALFLLYAGSIVLLVMVVPSLVALAAVPGLLWRGAVDWQSHLGGGRVRRLVAGESDQWFVCQADDDWREVSIAAGSVVYSRLLLLVLKGDDGWRRHLVLPADALIADAHRRLRVLLWCQGMAASEEPSLLRRWWQSGRRDSAPI